MANAEELEGLEQTQTKAIDKSLKALIRELFHEYFGTEPAPFFETYFNERIPDEERLGTLAVMNRTLERLKRHGSLPSKETMYSLIFDLTNYSYGEWWFSIRDLSSPAKKNALANDLAFVDAIAEKVWIKFSILVRGVRAGKLKISSMSPYSPVNTTLKALLVKFINLNAPFAQNDPHKSLVSDLFDRIFRKAHGTLKMLSMGLAGDAYASWRTLHEAECILALLIKDGEPLEEEYVKHIVYNNAFRGSLSDKAETDRIFEEMKAEMKEHDLKSKDMKKFIEYGWLYKSSGYKALVEKSLVFNRYALPDKDIPNKPQTFSLGPGPREGAIDRPLYDKYKPVLVNWDHDKLKDFKLNFRDGIEELAGLTRYSDWYETASEVTHSSPVFFYANDQFFFDLSTVALYQLCLRVSHLYNQVMAPEFKRSPNTKAVVEALISMCEAMNTDQCKRFQKIYGVDVFDETSIAKVPADRNPINANQDDSEGTKPGPILKEEEK